MKMKLASLAIVAALGLQGAAQAAASKPGVLAAITADAGEAFAGFAAFFAPTLGPGAIPAAAGLAASVQAEASGIAALDVGGYVLSDGLAKIHAGETITPANVVTPYAGGGGPSHPVIINYTHNGMAQLSDIRANAREIAQIIGNTFARQPSTRGAF